MRYLIITDAVGNIHSIPENNIRRIQYRDSYGEESKIRLTGNVTIAIEEKEEQ